MSELLLERRPMKSRAATAPAERCVGEETVPDWLADEVTQNAAQTTDVPDAAMRRVTGTVPKAALHQMAPGEIDAAVRQLRLEVTGARRSPSEHESRVETLVSYERELIDRRQPVIDLGLAVKQSRARVAARWAWLPEPNLKTAFTALAAREGAADEFLRGMSVGYSASRTPDAALRVLAEVKAHPDDFIAGYVQGELLGLWHGLESLGVGLVDMAKLGLTVAKIGLNLQPTVLAYRLATDPAFRAELGELWEQALATRDALLGFWTEFCADPTVILEMSSELGVAAGEAIANSVNGFLGLPLHKKGLVVGDVVGQAVFEVLFELVAAAFTAGIGNAVRAAAGAAQGVRANGRLARVIRRAMDASPVVRRFVEAIAAMQRGTRVAGKGESVARRVERGVGKEAHPSPTKVLSEEAPTAKALDEVVPSAEVPGGELPVAEKPVAKETVAGVLDEELPPEELDRKARSAKAPGGDEVAEGLGAARAEGLSDATASGIADELQEIDLQLKENVDLRRRLSELRRRCDEVDVRVRISASRLSGTRDPAARAALRQQWSELVRQRADAKKELNAFEAVLDEGGGLGSDDVIGRLSEERAALTEKLHPTPAHPEAVVVVDETLPLGGSWYQVETQGGHFHHTPAHAAGKLGYNVGPGLRLEIADHLETASWGTKGSAAEYRDVQKKLVYEHRYLDAIELDLRDIREKFGGRYRKGVLEMLDYVSKNPRIRELSKNSRVTVEQLRQVWL